MTVEQAYDFLEAEKSKLIKSIREGEHEQFYLDGVVKCKCGKHANWWKTGYVCSSITAYPCKYN